MRTSTLLVFITLSGLKLQYGKQTKALKLIVVSGSGPSLLGRDWLQKLCLDWQNIYHQISSPITLAGDASTYGIGSVISHVLPDGSERPIAYAS